MTSKLFRGVLIGPPASNLHRIAGTLTEWFDMLYVSGESVLKSSIVEHTRLGKQASTYLKKSLTIPDFLSVQMILIKLNEIENKSWILDYFPRSLPQASKLWEHYPMDEAFYVNVPLEDVIKRVQNRWVHMPSGRKYDLGVNDPKVKGKDDVTGEDLVRSFHDKPDVIKARMETYLRNMRPVVEFYKSKGIIHEYTGLDYQKIAGEIVVIMKTHLEEKRIHHRHAQLNDQHGQGDHGHGDNGHKDHGHEDKSK